MVTEMTKDKLLFITFVAQNYILVWSSPSTLSQHFNT